MLVSHCVSGRVDVSGGWKEELATSKASIGGLVSGRDWRRCCHTDLVYDSEDFSGCASG
jgi:hypothetical protein